MIASPCGETIFALSSGQPPSAIAIIRASGPLAGAALEAVAGDMPAPRMATYRSLRNMDGTPIDRAIVLWFPGDRTSTGEPIAEFHVHGSRAVVAAMADALVACGLRPAQAGEFTRRAFLNGRMDLTEVEGLSDLLAAETKAEHARAMRMAEGGLGRIIEHWRVTLLDVAARIEAEIEFGETDNDVQSAPPHELQDLVTLEREIGTMLDLPPAERLRDGVRIVIAGPPNAGKSSLCNALVGRDVALTTPIAGTTRDVIEAPVRWGDHAAVLIDTAGLRTSDDYIERLGIERTGQVIDDADLILWCGEPGECPDPDRSLMLLTRSDERASSGDRLPVSIFDEDSLALLRCNIQERIMGLVGQSGDLLLNVRQRSLTVELATVIHQAMQERDIVLMAEALRYALDLTDELVGRSGVEEMLDRLFSGFCIGK